VLHYCDNVSPLRDGELVLVDAGADVDGYCGDITRTYPVNGRFAPLQRQVYEIVLAAHSAACAAVRPGATLATVHQAACRALTVGLLELGALAGDPETLIRERAYLPFYPHKTSHWLGLDVHDPGPLPVPPAGTPLAPGMVLTVEPGLYFSPDGAEVPEPLRGLAVRIEDDLLVTGAGYEVLTGEVPRTVEAIEAFIAGV
jgi:Xaa-Pro aminopeptidase